MIFTISPTIKGGSVEGSLGLISLIYSTFWITLFSLKDTGVLEVITDFYFIRFIETEDVWLAYDTWIILRVHKKIRSGRLNSAAVVNVIN